MSDPALRFAVQFESRSTVYGTYTLEQLERVARLRDARRRRLRLPPFGENRDPGPEQGWPTPPRRTE